MYKPMLMSEYLSIWGIDGRTNNDREKDVVPDYSNTKINAERKRVSTIGNVRDVRFALSKYSTLAFYATTIALIVFCLFY